MVYRPSITSVPESLSTVENPFAVHSILAFSKGIICSAGLGTVHLFDKTEDKEMYKKTKEICIPADSQSADPEASRNQVINCLSLSPSEETLVSSTIDNQLYSITLSSADLGKVLVYLTLLASICMLFNVHTEDYLYIFPKKINLTNCLRAQIISQFRPCF